MLGDSEARRLRRSEAQTVGCSYARRLGRLNSQTWTLVLRLRLRHSDTHSRMLGGFVPHARRLGDLNSQARTLNLRLSSDARTLGDSDAWRLRCSETQTVRGSEAQMLGGSDARTLRCSDAWRLRGSEAQIGGSDVRRLRLRLGDDSDARRLGGSAVQITALKSRFSENKYFNFFWKYLKFIM